MITRTSAATCPTCLAPPKPHNPEDTGHTEDQLQITYATALLEAGIGIKTVSDQLGHASVAITGDIYQHVSDHAAQAAADALADAIGI